jgi:hypothetical protein
MSNHSRRYCPAIGRQSLNCRQMIYSRFSPTHSRGMTVDQFQAEARDWLKTARDPRWKRPYTELTYQPMQEVLSYLRVNGFKTYVVDRRRAGLRSGVLSRGLRRAG